MYNYTHGGWIGVLPSRKKKSGIQLILSEAKLNLALDKLGGGEGPYYLHRVIKCLNLGILVLSMATN